MHAGSLIDLEVVFLDCQTTGATPTRAHLLEIAWLRSTARRLLDPSSRANETPTSRIVSLPEGEEIPRTIQRITGIGPEHLLSARPATEIADELSAVLADEPPLVIHYARFELPFLADLATRASVAWPSESLEKILCTHEIARRTLATLPRRGLRALAGYFGEEVPELHRAGEHVFATAMVWAHLIRQLEEEREIKTIEGLVELLTEAPAERGGKRGYPMDREARLALKDEPGIYRMINRRGTVIYLGKATSLKKRVNSYFQKRKHAAERTLEMLTQAVTLEVTPTGSALEAAMLETDEIKRLAPRYNVALKTEQRRVVYVSRDLLTQSERRDEEHPLGPFSSFGSIGALGLMLLVLRCRAQQVELAPGLLSVVIRNIFGGYLEVDEAIAHEAFALLETSLDLTDESTLSYRALLRGARRWARRIAEREAARAGDSDVDESEDETTESIEPGDLSDATPEPPEAQEGWTPEQLAGALESITEQAIHSLRRARWLRSITEATLTWSRDKKSRPLRRIRLHRGHIVEALDVAKTKDPAPSSTVHTPSPRWSERDEVVFDVATYDRLRVLTTEIRRLVSEQRTIDLIVSPTQRLDTERLRMRLRRF
ncbi:MAG: exonuclease domain-containing protein [Polyangiaceae bacterium]